MARARNIKPGFFTNDKLGELHPLARILFIGMWTIADYKGCLEFRPKRIKAQILPYDECDLEELTINLDKSGFVQLYSVQGERYLKILNFEKHQNPHKNEREAGSEIPDVNEESIKNNKLQNIQINPEQNGTARADSLLPITDSLNPSKPTVTSSTSRFAEFWGTWPRTQRKVGKTKCEQKWKNRKLDEKADLIIDHVKSMKLTKKWIDGFEPSPETYINGSLWNDEVIRDIECKPKESSWRKDDNSILAKARDLKIGTAGLDRFQLIAKIEAKIYEQEGA